MAKKKDTPVRLDQLTEEEKMKYEIADELGLLDRVMKRRLEIVVIKKKPGELVEYLPEKGKIEVRSNKNITKNITNINKCEHFTRNLEKQRIVCYNRTATRC